MTPNEFRRLALSFPETEERSHMHHPDFRAAGKVFATLDYPDKSSGMVKLTPVEQEMFLKNEPEVFTPCAGAWGRAGCTNVQLKLAKKTSIHKALEAAWELAIGKSPANKRTKRPVKKKTASKNK